MDSRLNKARHSPEKERRTISLAERNKLYKRDLLHLVRWRDFIRQLLSYPVKLEEEGILKAWTNAFSEWRAELLTWMSIDDDHDHDVVKDNKPWDEMTQKALRCMEGLLPYEMILQIKHNGSPIFNLNDAIPKAVIDLTVDLALEQLIQTLVSRDDNACNIRYVTLSTRNSVEKRSVVNKIAAALEDKHNLFGLHKDFRKAIWIDASKYQSDAAEVQVQKEINMMMAGVVTEDDSILHTRCIEEEMASKRYLVIIVDGEKLDPTKVHFPAGIVVLITTEPSAQAQKISKFTRTMDLNIRTLDHQLPWEVFCSIADNIMVYSPKAIQRIAVQIVEQCRGHLLATVLVAKSLRGVEDVKQWELALDKLSYTNPSYDYQESDRTGISRAMVNAFVNIIWEGIEEKQKLCLELSLFVHNIKSGVSMTTLMSYWVNNNELSLKHEAVQHFFSFDSVDTEVEYAREEAERDIEELQDRCILLQCQSGCVHLPVETYDIIESLHTMNPSVLMSGALGLTELPHIERWHGLVRIELMDNKICELPLSLDCPKLAALLLQGNADLTDIPTSFFDHMPLLRYLDLSYTNIRDLPHSISKLIKLEKFYLRGCDLFLELPPEIGQLKTLKELDLNGTFITHLPKEVRELINLGSLTLCFEGYHHVFGHDKTGKQISNSTIIPSGVISNLTRLNCLSINVDPEDEQWNENIASILPEILELQNLQSFDTYVPNADFLELIPPHKFLSFRFIVGHHMQRFISRVAPEVEQNFKKNDTSIKFVNGVDVPNGVKMNLWRFGALYLDRHWTIKSLSEFELKNLDELQVCILAECNEMETIVDGSYSDEAFECALPNLVSLSVFYMKNLRRICKGNILGFHCLKSIALHTCPMLTTIFNLSLIRNLYLLEELIVEDCPKVTTLISHDLSKHETRIFLPKLRKISLLFLPSLVSIFNGLHVEHGIEKMEFYYCPNLHSLSKSELSSESLRVIKGESRWWETLKWNEGEWGCAIRPNFLDQIFSPLNDEADMTTQLALHVNEGKPPLMNATDDQLNLEDMDIIKVVGKGSRGVVQLAQHKQTSQLFALKVIKMNTEESMLKQIIQKLKINQSAQCPYLVVCYQLFHDNGAISIILEYMDGGSLADLLKKVRTIPESYLAAICEQVLKGLRYLHHERHIIHRDLKPSNLLINHRGEVKITDFGVSAIMEGTSALANTLTGTYNYMSPERISASRDGYNYKSDIWSLGLTLLECAMGRFPYTPPDESKSWESIFELMETIVDQPPPSAPSEKFSEEFCSFISACLEKDPRDRPSAQELMRHPFIYMYEDLDLDLSAYFSIARSPLQPYES